MICKKNRLFILIFILGGLVLGHTNESIDSLLKVAAKYDQLSQEKASTYLALSDAYREINNDSIYFYNEQALKIINALDLPALQLQYFINKGYWFAKGAEFDSAVHYLDKTKPLLDKYGDLNLRLEVLSNYGIVFHHLGDFDKVLSYNQQALDLMDEDNILLPRFYYNRAIVFINMNMMAQAKNYFNLSFQSAQKFNEVNGEVGAIKGMAYILGTVEGKIDSANRYLERGKEICVETQSPELCLEIYEIIAQTYSSQGAFKLADKNYKTSLRYAEQWGDDYTLMQSLMVNARSATHLKEYTNAENYYLRFEKLFEENKFYDLAVKVYESWANMESTRTHYQRSNALYQKFSAAKDTVDRRVNRNALADAEAKYQNEKAKSELIKSEAALEKRTAQKNSVVFGMALLTLLGGSLVWGLLMRIKSNKAVQHQKIAQLEKDKETANLNAMMEGQEVERKRIAKDLHDGLGSLLSTIKAHFSNLSDEIQKQEKQKVYHRTNEMIDEATDEVRRISHNLMPGALWLTGLKTAIEQLGYELNETNDFRVNVEVIGCEERMEEGKELFIYRIIQESFTNIIKHSDAKNVLIQLTETDLEYHLIIEDDGQGFDLSEAKSGLGLNSIRSRVDYLDGGLDIDSRIGVGTTITIHMPKEKVVS